MMPFERINMYRCGAGADTAPEPPGSSTGTVVGNCFWLMLLGG